MHNSRGKMWLPGAVLGCLATAFLLTSAGCSSGDDDANAQRQGHRVQAHGSPEQRQRPEQPPTPVAVQAATTGDIASYYNATATLEAEKEAEILARVEGVIKSLQCEEGDLVDVGSELLRIKNDEYRLRLDQAEANSANLRSRFDRVSKMMEEELTTDEEFQTARSELAAAEADEGMARLIQRLVDVGQNVSAGTPLFVLADFDPLLARVHVPSKEFKKLAIDQTVTLILDSDRQRLQGSIKLISPIIDPSSGTIKITLEIPDYPPSTRPGDFAEVQIVTERRTGRILVPKSAVLSDLGEDVVYIATEGAAERRVGEVGFRDNDNAEILAGVEPGELIVVKGQRSLKHGDPLKILDSAESATQPASVARAGES
jgi:membrane fusion protein (multidrug efflux system)